MIVVALIAGAYQLVALIAVLLFIVRRDRSAQSFPPVSILKPMNGRSIRAAASHLKLDYPEYEIIFGDPAESESGDRARVVRSKTLAPNRKAGVLADLAAAARYEILVVNDADIVVPVNYLRQVVAPLADPQVGLVTCLYAGRSNSWAGRWESLGIATDFAPSVLVARWLGVREFGLGSTLCFRRSELEAIGGFKSIAEYIADDYQLARRIRELGFRVQLSRMVVETDLGSPSWRDIWRHQVRWARTIRVSRGGLLGYLGLPVTFATMWAVIIGGSAGLALLGLRLAVAVIAGFGALGDRKALFMLPLAPLRDLWGVAVWAAGLVGSRVVWGDASLVLDREGRIVSHEPC